MREVTEFAKMTLKMKNTFEGQKQAKMEINETITVTQLTPHNMLLQYSLTNSIKVSQNEKMYKNLQFVSKIVCSTALQKTAIDQNSPKCNKCIKL